ncbi:SDR family oxidoreductase [Microbulbifer sp. GL-2]|uniref:SDR family oxidoreductase n=1 Tax=Microbulbifer sp. GL-2 TaxID=2591606 RepID=UPI0011628B6E|nr:SDR family oxidoreductase [Microbulbifer sp. GL-2]BBM01825.1 dehydrogenase [Microbulbifer sp. GL-2]
MDLGIEGRNGLICGASRGLGFACAKALASEGVHTTIVARTKSALDQAADTIEGDCGLRPRVIVADISGEDGLQKVIRECENPDILVTNAGGPPGQDFRTLTRKQWIDALDTNFLSAEALIRLYINGMIKRQFGRIVNITSMTVRSPVKELDLSNAVRLALTGYTAGVARQVIEHNVTLNNLLPGPIMTERLLDLGDIARDLISKVPAGRAGKPDELGAACAFLCSQLAGFITGQNLLVDGGYCSFTV